MDYRDLKIGKHGLPTSEAMVPVVIKFLSDEKIRPLRTILIDVADSLELPENLRNMESDNYHDNVIENRINWSINFLYTAKVIDRISRGVYKISQSGLNELKKGDKYITQKELQKLEAYQDYLNELARRHEDKPVDVDELTEKVTNYNDEVAAKLLRIIQDSEPTFFEGLVVKLLSKMGYKGENGSSRVTKATNDGGIDGVINQDPLGTNTIYIQAKRYKSDNVVQRPAIDGFYGALSRVHADRGVFITTSHFSSSAITTAKNFSIVLIDGIQLTNLMLQYQVGVQVKKHLDLFEIDEDFFED